MWIQNLYLNISVLAVSISVLFIPLAHARLFKAQLFSYICDPNEVPQEVTGIVLARIAKNDPKHFSYSKNHEACGTIYTMIEKDDNNDIKHFGVYFDDEKSCKCFLFENLLSVVLGGKLSITLKEFGDMIKQWRFQRPQPDKKGSK